MASSSLGWRSHIAPSEDCSLEPNINFSNWQLHIAGPVVLSTIIQTLIKIVYTHTYIIASHKINYLTSLARIKKNVRRKLFLELEKPRRMKLFWLFSVHCMSVIISLATNVIFWQNRPSSLVCVII